MTPQTLPELTRSAFDRYNRRDHYGVKRSGRWVMLSTLEVREQAHQLAGALHRRGIRRGDRVAIVSPTRLEWALSDYAILSLGAVVVPVYPSLSPAAMVWPLRHSEARLALVGGAGELGKLRKIRSEVPSLGEVVSFDALPGAEAGSGVSSFQDLLARSGPSPDVALTGEDLASIIYTSGTTGEPKGVMLTHGNIVSNVLACTQHLPFRSDDVHLSFLPLCHIFERMVHYYMMWNGVSTFFASDLSKVREEIAEVRPTVLTSIPRVLEKVMAGVQERTRAPGLPGRIAAFGIDTAREWARAAWGIRREVGPLLAFRHQVADVLVLRKVRAAMGGRIRTIVTGGAATPVHCTEFFLGAGIKVMPGYGLTEHSPVIAFNTPAAFRFDTVGRPLGGLEVRIAADGEILARGPSVMRGYYRNEEATREAIDSDDWLHTGDIGTLDSDGFLAVTDRKKDLLVTAGGKNVAPQAIERLLAEEPLIAQSVLVGDGRPYITALIVPSFEALQKWARARGIDGGSANLVRHKDVQALYRERIDARCRDLSPFETIKRFALLDRELSEAEGELTPTLKVRRKVVNERFAQVIEELYSARPGG